MVTEMRRWKLLRCCATFHGVALFGSYGDIDTADSDLPRQIDQRDHIAVWDRRVSQQQQLASLGTQRGAREFRPQLLVLFGKVKLVTNIVEEHQGLRTFGALNPDHDDAGAALHPFT